MERRRLGRIGHDSSVLILGGVALANCTQDAADATIREALDAGINHIDTAAIYGESEDRLGPWMGDIRDRVFLASKVTERSDEAAWASINRSLERLRVDRLDLLQIHSVCDLPTLDAVTAADGALRAVVRARDEGLATHLGITGHTHAAPSVHLEALRRFDFDSVLTPWNWKLARDPAYHADFDALVAEMRSRDVALMTIKATARRNWEHGEKAYDTWYRPLDRQEEVTAAIAWVLAHPYVTALATAGEASLLRLAVEAERQRAAMTPERIEEILGRMPDYASPFDERMPNI